MRSAKILSATDADLETRPTLINTVRKNAARGFLTIIGPP